MSLVVCSLSQNNQLTRLLLETCDNSLPGLAALLQASPPLHRDQYDILSFPVLTLHFTIRSPFFVSFGLYLVVVYSCFLCIFFRYFIQFPGTHFRTISSPFHRHFTPYHHNLHHNLHSLFLIPPQPIYLLSVPSTSVMHATSGYIIYVSFLFEDYHC